MKVIILFFSLFSFLCLSADEDVFDLEEGAVKKEKVREIASLENLQTMLRNGKYSKLAASIRVWSEHQKEEIKKVAFRKVLVRYQLETGKYKEALKELAKQPLNEDDYGYYLHCQALVKVGDLEQARKLAEEGLAKFSESYSMTFMLHQLAELTGDLKLDARMWSRVKKFYSKSRSGRDGEALDIALLGRCIQKRSPQKSYNLFQRAYKKDLEIADIYVWAGRHCSEKYEWNFAIEELRKALEINSNHAQAKAAMAYVLMEKGDYQKARELVSEALEVNPNLSEALQLLSKIYIVDDRKKESWKVLKHGLSVNAKDLKILSQMAAGSHQDGNFEQRDKYIADVHEINSKYNKIYLEIAQSCEDLRQFPEAVSWAKKAIENNSRDWEGYYVAGMNLLRLGEETEGYNTLDRAFKLNGFNIWARNILVLLDRDFKRKEFRQFETEHFVIKLHRSEADIMFPYLEKVVEDAYEKYTKKYGIEPIGPKEYDGKILLLMFDRHNDFSARTVGLPGLGALGACFGQIITMPSPIIGKGNDRSKFHWKRVFEHEFIHVLTLQKSSYYVPRWFTEGVSTWEEEDPQGEVDRQLQWAWENGRLLPLEDINSGFSQQTYPNQIGVSYYHASLICRYINDTYGFPVIQKMLDLFKEGKSNEVVLREATQKSLSDLNKEVKLYLDAYISQIPLKTPLPENEILDLENKNKSFGLPLDKLLDLAAAYIRQSRQKDSRVLVEKVLKEEPNNVRALNMNAMLYFHADEKEKASNEFSKVLELQENHYVANYFMAMMSEEKEQWAEAVKFYEGALRQYARVEPGRANIYFKLVDLYDKLEKGEKSLDVLKRHTINNNKSFVGFVKYGKRLLEADKKQQAAVALQEANYIYPFDLEVHMKLAPLLFEFEDFTGAEREYEVALELAPRNKLALKGLYDLYIKINKREKAEEVLQTFKRFYPEEVFE